MRYISTYEVYRPPKYLMDDQKKVTMNLAARLEYHLKKYFNFTKEDNTIIYVDWYTPPEFKIMRVLISGFLPLSDDIRVRSLTSAMEKIGVLRLPYMTYYWDITHLQAEELLKMAKDRFSLIEAELYANKYNL
jgi:hypothetical protein